MCYHTYSHIAIVIPQRFLQDQPYSWYMLVPSKATSFFTNRHPRWPSSTFWIPPRNCNSLFCCQPLVSCTWSPSVSPGNGGQTAVPKMDQLVRFGGFGKGQSWFPRCPPWINPEYIECQICCLMLLQILWIDLSESIPIQVGFIIVLFKGLNQQGINMPSF